MTLTHWAPCECCGKFLFGYTEPVEAALNRAQATLLTGSIPAEGSPVKCTFCGFEKSGPMTRELLRPISTATAWVYSKE